MGGLERYGTLPLGSAVCHRRFTLAGSRRGGRVAEGTRLLSEYGDQTPSRVRIPPSPLEGRFLQWPLTAPVAQLDRASVYGTEGQRFESSRARSRIPLGGGDFRPSPNAERWQHRWQQGNTDGVATEGDRRAGGLPAWFEVHRGLPR